MSKFTCVSALVILAASSVSATTFNTFTDRASFNAATGTVQEQWVLTLDGTANANFVVNKNFNSVVLTFANAVTAFGADFASLNNADELSVEFEVNGERITPPVQGANNVQFFGFTSDMAFTSVSLVGASATSPFDGFAGDNITFGDAIEATVVPLPAPAALLIAALGGLFFVGRRKA